MPWYYPVHGGLTQANVPRGGVVGLYCLYAGLVLLLGAINYSSHLDVMGNEGDDRDGCEDDKKDRPPSVPAACFEQLVR